ncbi:MAG: inositol monophosphatase [Fimbriimonadaceae bacterium]|nr:inositol monophosphatase [Chitinophagales bacterium]
MNLEKICFEAMDVIKEVGEYIRHEKKHLQSMHVESKGIRDFVTHIDKNSERMLAEKLQNILPEAGFITEEKVVEQTNNKLKWIIDPLDGTMNYIHGIPIYSISVALMDEQEIILGIVYEINNDEMFYTWKGTIAYMNGNAIHISTCSEIKNALIVTGFPYTRTNRVAGIIKTLGYFLERCRDVRRLGSAAVDLCYVAAGRIDVYYEGYLNIWDIAAGILIVKNAGGVVSDFEGTENYFAGNIIATNNVMYPEIVKGIEFNIK